MLRLGGRFAAHDRLGRFASSHAGGVLALTDRALIRRSIAVDTTLTCNSCNKSFDGGEAPLFKCPDAGDGADHGTELPLVLRRLVRWCLALI